MLLQAQDYFLLRFGGTLSTQSGIESGLKPGLVAGIGYEYQLSNKWWLQSNLDYIQKGADVGVVGNVTQFSNRFEYWEASIYLQNKYFVTENINWSFFGGPNIGITSVAKSRYFRIAQPEIVIYVVGDPNGASQTDFGLNVGADINFRTDYGYLSLYSSFHFGLTKAGNDLFANELSNRVISFGLIGKFGKPLVDPNPLYEMPKTEKKERKRKRKRRNG